MRKANKIVMMTVAILLSAVLLTTSALSGTLAKYVTSGGSYSDSARVAKWGVSIDIDPDETVLNRVYKDFDASKNMKVTVDKSGTQATVVITNLKMGPGDNLRDMLRIRFDGTAEVKLQVKVSQGILYGGDYTAHDGIPKADYEIFRFAGGDTDDKSDDEYYVPMAFTFGGLYYNKNTKKYTSVINDPNPEINANYEYALAPWRYYKGSKPSGSGSEIGMNTAETNYMEYAAGKFEDAVTHVAADGSTSADKRDARIKKTFEPNDPLVFKTKNGIDVNTLAFGVEWPFTWSSSATDGRKTTEAEYDDLATEFARRAEAASIKFTESGEHNKYYVTLVYNISITQVNN